MWMLGFILDDIDAYNEKMGESVGSVAAVLLLAVVVVWWIRKSRPK